MKYDISEFEFRRLEAKDIDSVMALQGILMRRLEQLAVERGYTDLCASISPQNSFSLNNALMLGYKVDHLAIKYGGLERAIVVKKLI